MAVVYDPVCPHRNEPIQTRADWSWLFTSLEVPVEFQEGRDFVVVRVPPSSATVVNAYLTAIGDLLIPYGIVVYVDKLSWFSRVLIFLGLKGFTSWR